MLGVTADELCTVYRTQFAVLYGYDHNEYTYDANGRLVPNPVLRAWRSKGDRITDGPFAESKEAIGGYIFLTVRDLDEATAIARDCPGLPLGLVVEVRPVAAVSPVLEGVPGRPPGK